MASLPATSVTIKRSYTEGDVTGKRQTVLHVQFTTLGSPGNGSATNPIPASAFGLTEIHEVSSMYNQDDVLLVPACTTETGDKVLLADVNNITAASQGVPVDYISKIFHGVIRGRV